MRPIEPLKMGLPRSPVSIEDASNAASSAASHGMDKPPTSTSLSVIVPAYNEQYLIETSLARLKVLDGSPLLHSVKVIVVDDGSTDGTAEAIERFRMSLDSVQSKGNISWAFARNQKNSG
jgi:cellulose synthase/poly-beta-1,6-N-acetylglucosamine synthase-like glycosyltransferase